MSPPPPKHGFTGVVIDTLPEIHSCYCGKRGERGDIELHIFVEGLRSAVKRLSFVPVLHGFKADTATASEMLDALAKVTLFLEQGLAQARADLQEN